MKKTNLILFVIAGILAITNLMQGQTITADTAWYRNNTVMQVNTYLDDIKIERCVYYPTGELQLYQEFDARTGVQAGDEYWYYRNGEVQHACEWVNGFAHGWAFTWDEIGGLISSQVYVENRLVPTEDYAKYFPDREADSERASASGFAARR